MQYEPLYGDSPAFRKCLELADEYSKTPWPILITGETGVGKELIARRIHAKSPYSGAVFSALNCGAVPPSLFESELFGYERGAFSGAFQNYRGLIRASQGGTLFLDEIGEMEPPMQVKLLRWLDSGELRALGSVKFEKATPRLLAATHVDLADAVARGNFRLDLLERLSVLVLRVPSLRERPDDILPIARGLLKQHTAACQDADLEGLKSFTWPGNVRQLRNVLLRAVARGKGRVTAGLLETLLTDERALAQCLQREAGLEGGPLADIEKRVIIDRIRRCHGNKKMAAKELGIAKSTLHEKIRRWKTEEDDGFSPLLLGS